MTFYHEQPTEYEVDPEYHQLFQLSYDLCKSIRDDLTRILNLNPDSKHDRIHAARHVCGHVCDCLSGTILVASTNLAGPGLILLRSAYEASVRLLWASGQPDGWNRELYRMVLEDIKTLTSNIDANHSVEHSRAVLAEREKYKQYWRTGDGKKYSTKIPDFKTLLNDIETQAGLKEILPLYPNNAKFHYTAFYRSLSMSTHSHFFAIGNRVHKATDIAAVSIGAFCAQSLTISALRTGGAAIEIHEDRYYNNIKSLYQQIIYVVDNKNNTDS